MATEPPGAALRASLPGLPGLSGSFSGRLVVPDDPGYDEARRVWNGTVDRRPAALAYCRSTSDVSAAVRAARQTGLPLSVRGGGHQVAGLSLSDGGLVIDLSEMNTVTLNADHTIARAGGGCLLRHVDTTTSEVGRIVPAGVVSHTGLGGLALGGGVGWTFRNFGLTWARDTYSSLDSVGSEAGYINFLELEPDRVLSVYPPATYERLRRTKRRLDPDNVFHGNVPIAPAP